MRLGDLDLLRCPFCGSTFEIDSQPAPVFVGDELSTGVLSCRCCAYPVVDGIPFIRPDDTARSVVSLLASGQTEDARLALLNLSGARADQFRALQQATPAATYRQTLELLSPDLEGTYFLYRFSDPTYLVSEALLRALGQNTRLARGPVLDMCGGSGHLTRTLASITPAASVWLADFDFWKAWLARTFIAPGSHAVCCDANQALPFARDSFSLVLCSGAFEYIWPRRSFAGEMWRLAGAHGAVVLTHTHNALCENYYPGMPLPPADYRNLFEEVAPRLFKESRVLDAVLAGKALDLGAACTDEALADEPALIIIATRHAEIFRLYEPSAQAVPLHLAWNPLYRATEASGPLVRQLAFPSPYYETEFAECRRYLPERVEVNAAHAPGEADVRELIRRRVLLDVPEHYL